MTPVEDLVTVAPEDTIDEAEVRERAWRAARSAA
jgi:hypothetical protein